MKNKLEQIEKLLGEVKNQLSNNSLQLNTAIRESLKAEKDLLEDLYGKPLQNTQQLLKPPFEDGQIVYVIDGLEYEEIEWDNWYDFLWSAGQVYATKEKAEKEIKRRQVMHKLRCYAKGFEPDWDDKERDKYKILYDAHHKKWEIANPSYICDLGQVYFATKEDAQRAIDELGDELEVLR